VQSGTASQAARARTPLRAGVCVPPGSRQARGCPPCRSGLAGTLALPVVSPSRLRWSRHEQAVKALGEEACTNLRAWKPVFTNTVRTNVVFYTDPGAGRGVAENEGRLAHFRPRLRWSRPSRHHPTRSAASCAGAGDPPPDAPAFAPGWAIRRFRWPGRVMTAPNIPQRLEGVFLSPQLSPKAPTSPNISFAFNCA